MTIFDKLIKKLFNIEDENKSKKSDGKYENQTNSLSNSLNYI